MSEFIYNASMENSLSNIARSVHDIAMNGKGVLKDINNQLGAITVELRRINAMNEEKEDGENQNYIFSETDKKLLTNLYTFLALEHDFQKGTDGEILSAKECYDMSVAHESDEIGALLKYELSDIFKHINEAIKCGLFYITLPDVYHSCTHEILEKYGFVVDCGFGTVIIGWENNIQYKEDVSMGKRT